jgi:8-oxo-dGTP pyrophosphatase MutT (NUDIX family)
VADQLELLTHPEALRARIEAALASRGDVSKPLPPGIRRAAVLLMVVHAGGEAALLLTKRSEEVERHKGQISLPGGGVEPGEEPLAAALRETAEEIGVRAADVTILGALDEEETVVSGFRLTPFVGTIPYPYPLQISPAEVTAVLEAPIRVLLDPRNVQAEVWDHGGGSRIYYSYAVGSDVVWGATGRVISQFLHAVFGARVPPDLDGRPARRKR